MGQRPFDQLVDLSNFVMLDLGQPNHVFDRARLSPEGIVVRRARAGETMQTLDGFDRKLRDSDLLICSGDEPVALAGIMGGEGSKVGSDTGTLLLEVANFDPAVIRRTWRLRPSRMVSASQASGTDLRNRTGGSRGGRAGAWSSRRTTHGCVWYPPMVTPRASCAS